jgi:ribosomal protein S18 acetylase RimI-like enzyme
VKIESVKESTPELVEAFARLLPQLSTSASSPDEAAIQEMLSSDCTALLVARSDALEIVGMLTLAVLPIPTGRRAWIEDVVVDHAARGSGIGAALVDEALRLAETRGARTVDLTSRPDRVEANRLYEHLGSQRRETTVFRFEQSRP